MRMKVKNLNPDYFFDIFTPSGKHSTATFGISISPFERSNRLKVYGLNFTERI